jgi:hypothetical protein
MMLTNDADFFALLELLLVMAKLVNGTFNFSHHLT